VALFGLLSIGVLVGRLEHLADRDPRLPVELPTELMVMIEPADETGDYFSFKDVRNLVPYFREAPDVAPKELSCPFVDPGEVMLCCRPLAGPLLVFNEHSLEVIPRVNDIAGGW
jgi:hypothetical protein